MKVTRILFGSSVKEGGRSSGIKDGWFVLPYRMPETAEEAARLRQPLWQRMLPFQQPPKPSSDSSSSGEYPTDIGRLRPKDAIQIVGLTHTM